MADEHAHVIRVAKYRAAPGMQDQLLARMHELAQAMRELPGLFGAQVCALDEAPEWLAIISRWRDEEAMRGIVGTRAAALTEDVVGLADQEDIERFVSV